ncbi:MAG: hypothetical protein VX988_00645 [Planctomycetota bacterium]|nr:hypothetical protein [Planctomycetota bacterium]
MKTVGAYIKDWPGQSRLVAKCMQRCGAAGDVRIQPFAVDGQWGDSGEIQPGGLHESTHPLICLHPTSPGCFDSAFVAPDLTVFENAWATALLRQLNDSLKDDGIICLPWRKGLENPPKGWSRAWLQQQFGDLLQTFRSPASPLLDLPWRGRPTWFGCFHRRDDMPAPSSVLTWWFRDHAAARDEHVAMLLGKSTPLNGNLRSRCSEFLLSETNVSDTPFSADPAEPYSLPSTLDAETFSALRSHQNTMSYALTGANYKSAVMGHILETRFSHDRPLRIVDHGGGLGQFVIELLLENPRVEMAVNCDVNPLHLMLSARVFEFFRDLLRGRYFMQLQPSEEFDYDSSCDVISFMGSMLYLPRGGLDNTLDRGWNALNPGGLLVIHENIKHESFARDYEIMFTAEELNARLERFGKIEYYASTSCKRLPPDKVGNKCVFRVIQKSS